jgi:predicted kinase
MTKFIATIGLPGSGKSSISRPFAEKNDYVYISSDAVRLEVTHDPYDMSREMEVWDEIKRRIRENLEAQHTVVLDSTLTSEKVRSQILELARECGVQKIQGLYVDIPEEVSRERNAGREVVVPDEHITRMSKRLEEFPPELSEGFDSIIHLDEHGEITEVEMKREDREMRREFRVR